MNHSDLNLLTRLPELSEEEKHQRTLAGLADVDAGRLTSSRGNEVVDAVSFLPAFDLGLDFIPWETAAIASRRLVTWQ